MLKYIFCSTGHCGSRYLAKLVTSAGVQCSHEKVFRPKCISKTYVERGGLEAESSAFAVAYLDDPWVKKQGAKIYRIVRHPLKTMRSWLLSSSGWGRACYPFFANIIEKDCPELWPGTIPLRAGAMPHRNPDWLASFYICWNGYIGRSADQTIKIERNERILTDIGLDIPENYFSNTKDHQHAPGSAEELEWSCVINDNLRELLIATAGELGYETDDNESSGSDGDKGVRGADSSS